MRQLVVKEIFYSLQGEGANTGRASVFVRLAGCNRACSFCDTDFFGGEPLTLKEIATAIRAFHTDTLLIWTGGEPTLQLTEEDIAYFHALGYEQAIETNGTRPVPTGIDYISCSPKEVSSEELWANFPRGVSEWRFLVDVDMPMPIFEELPPAKHYFLSPAFADRATLPDVQALKLCLDFIATDPRWRLSLQMHKLIDIL